MSATTKSTSSSSSPTSSSSSSSSSLPSRFSAETKSSWSQVHVLLGQLRELQQQIAAQSKVTVDQLVTARPPTPPPAPVESDTTITDEEIAKETAEGSASASTSSSIKLFATSTVDEMVNWFAQFKVEADKIRENQIDGKIATLLTDTMLKEDLAITNGITRVRILTAIDEARKPAEIPAPSASSSSPSSSSPTSSSSALVAESKNVSSSIASDPLLVNQSLLIQDILSRMMQAIALGWFDLVIDKYVALANTHVQTMCDKYKQITLVQQKAGLERWKVAILKGLDGLAFKVVHGFREREFYQKVYAELGLSGTQLDWFERETAVVMAGLARRNVEHIKLAGVVTPTPGSEGAKALVAATVTSTVRPAPAAAALGTTSATTAAVASTAVTATKASTSMTSALSTARAAVVRGAAKEVAEAEGELVKSALKAAAKLGVFLVKMVVTVATHGAVRL